MILTSKRQHGLRLLKVTGTSMVKIGIKDGNLIAFRPIDKLIDGEVMAVKYKDEVIIKRVFVGENEVRLFNEDGKGSNLVVLKDEVEPRGIILGTLTYIGRVKRLKKGGLAHYSQPVHYQDHEDYEKIG